MIYRPDIYGLRAVSIIAVVLFHFGVPHFGGGFVGVDVFFVISGYLITKLVMGDIGQGTFSLANFYARRARRLLPTLFVVLVATLIASLAIMTPQDFADFSRSLFYTLCFSANIFFADQGGYFAPSLEFAPLLHMWSLAVEEQFYFVWPLLCLIVIRFRPKLLPAVVLLVLVASFVLSVVGVEEKPHAAFFHPHTRIWELLVGCTLALGMPAITRGKSVVGYFGIALILAAVFLYDKSLPFPGVAALVPVLGAALVIWSSEGAPSGVGRVLSLRLLVFVGLVSYAWYLWHWPMVTLLRYHLERELSGGETLLLLAASFALAVLCWRYLEQPIRHRRWWAPLPRVAAWTIVPALALMSFAGIGYATDGFIAHYPQAVRELSREHLKRRPQDRPCPRQTDPRDLCPLWEGKDDRQRILLWGDSHASALKPVFYDIAEASEVSVHVASQGACPPLIGVGNERSSDNPTACVTMNDLVGGLVRERKFTDVVLAARWNYYLGGEDGNGPAATQHYIEDDNLHSKSLQTNRLVMSRGLRRTLDAITASGARAWIVMEAPFAGFDVPNRLVRRLIDGGAPLSPYGLSLAEYDRRTKPLEEMLSGLPVTKIYPSERLCSDGRCLILADGKPLYLDDDHLSVFGAEKIAPLFRDLFSRSQNAGLPARQQ